MNWSNWWIDKTLTDITAPGLSGPGSNGNEMIHTGASPPDSWQEVFSEEDKSAHSKPWWKDEFFYFFHYIYIYIYIYIYAHIQQFFFQL